MITSVQPRASGGFRHEALFYAGLPEFVSSVGAFISDGLAADEPAFVAVNADKIAALREDLGADADAVRFADMAAIGGNPARIIPVWREFVDAHPGRCVRGVGEPIYPARGPDELVECQQHEVLLNVAFADSSEWCLACPYDVDALEPAVIAEARRSHPFVARNGERWASAAYCDVSAMDGPFDDPLPEPHGSVEEHTFDGGPLTGIRALLARRGVAAGLAPERVDDLVLAVDELLSNSVRHAGGSATLRLWQEPDAVVCEVRDGGRIDEPLAGRLIPEPDGGQGWGLWLVNQLCDLVQLRSSATGTVVRLHMRRGA